MTESQVACPSADAPGGYRRVPIEVEDYELASARLDWAQATTCLHLPGQREALGWHRASRDAAYAVLAVGGPAEETP